MKKTLLMGVIGVFLLLFVGGATLAGAKGHHSGHKHHHHHGRYIETYSYYLDDDRSLYSDRMLTPSQKDFMNRLDRGLEYRGILRPY